MCIIVAHTKEHIMGTMIQQRTLCRNGAIKTYEDVRIENGKRIVERFAYVPSAIVRDVAQRLLDGVPYKIASIRMELDKPMLAFIHANAERILNLQTEYGYLYSMGDEGWLPVD